MRNVIFHNPRCSKSRATVKLLEEHQIEISVIEYLKEAPTVKELHYVCQQKKFIL